MPRTNVRKLVALVAVSTVAALAPLTAAHAGSSGQCKKCTSTAPAPTTTSSTTSTTAPAPTTTTTTAPAPSDTTVPSVSISSPGSAATVSGTVSVTGTAADNAGLARVETAVDNGAFSLASGTSSWTASWNTTGVADGSHTVTARATDTSGNTKTSAVTVTVANGTPAPPPPPSSTTAPDTQGSWTSPEGVHINVNTAGPFTIRMVYGYLTASARELSTIGPSLTVEVQDASASQTVTSVKGGSGTPYYGFSAKVYLKGVNSTFATQPDAQTAHEYGHVWTLYHLYMTHAGDWSAYVDTRWSSADGSMTLAQDSRLDSTYSWSRAEIIADDYRLLFGSSLAVSQRPKHLNAYVVDPRNQAGLRDWFAQTWG